MNGERVDRLSGRRVVITPERQDRPNHPPAGCPFCPGGVEAPEPYEVRWFVNRWPAMDTARCEVVLYSPLHDASFWQLGVDGATRVVQLWGERTAALGARPDVSYVLAFENRGADVGATIPHPHGQIYAFGAVPPAPALELASARCVLCEPAVPAFVVRNRDGFRTWVPEAAAWPFELLLAPEAHIADLPSSPDAHEGLAAALVDATHRLDLLFDEPMPYMLWVHQRPTTADSWPLAHVHVHIAPFNRAPATGRFVAAGELGSGIYFNPIDPAAAADRLRATKP